jgi:hypothetical protein
LFAVGVVGSCAGPVAEGEGEGEEGEGEEGEGEEGEGEGEGEGEAFSARFVAVGYGGRRLTSEDGRAWTNDVEDAAAGGDDDDLLRGSCAGTLNGARIVLAVGGSAQGRVMRSVDGGERWTEIVDDEGWIGACAFDGSTFVFVGSARSARSLDGGLTLVDRETHFLEPGGSWEMRDVIFVDELGRFVAAGDLGVSTSDDGVVWTDPTGPQNLFRVAHGNGVVVVMGPSVRASSSDLLAFNDQATASINDIVFAEGRFLIVGEGFRQTSANGVDWVQENQPAMARVVFGVVDGAPVYVGAQFSDRRRLSSDGISWEDVANDDGNAIDDLVFIP